MSSPPPSTPPPSDGPAAAGPAGELPPPPRPVRAYSTGETPPDLKGPLPPMGRAPWRKLASAAARVLLLVVIAVGAFLLILRWNEPRMLYPVPEIEHWDYRADDYGIDPTDHWPVTSDGVKLHAWYLPPPVDPEGPVVLFSHGNGDLVGRLAGRLVFFRDMGAGGFAYDYRGYGKSDAARVHEEGTIRDAVAAHDYLTGTLGIAPDRIVAYGHSLGAAVSLGLAERRPLAGVILEAPFTNINEMAHEVLKIRWLGPLVRLAVANDYDNLVRVRRLAAPLLVIHGKHDEIVPVRMGRRIAAEAPAAAAARFVELNARHNDVPWNDDARYIEAVSELLAGATGRLLQPPPRGRRAALPADSPVEP